MTTVPAGTTGAGPRPDAAGAAVCAAAVVVAVTASAGVLVPLVYEAHRGFGWFSFSGPDGWKLPLAILVWHLVFAVHIGALHKPTRTRRIRQAEGL